MGEKEMKISKEFINNIESNCTAGENLGCLYCNKCRHIVEVDWFGKELNCIGCDDL